MRGLYDAEWTELRWSLAVSTMPEPRPFALLRDSESFTEDPEERVGGEDSSDPVVLTPCGDQASSKSTSTVHLHDDSDGPCSSQPLWSFVHTCVTNSVTARRKLHAIDRPSLVFAPASLLST